MFSKKPPFSKLIGLHAEELVSAIYQGLLERKSDRVGLEHYAKFLRDGGTISSLLRGFATSEEFLLVSEGRRQEFLDAKVPMLREPDQKIAIFTNCQGGNLGRCIQALTGAQPPKFNFVTGKEIIDPSLTVGAFRTAVAENDVVLLQPQYADALQRLGTESMQKVMLFPSISFPAFQPDQCYVQIKGTLEEVNGPLGPYHSAIAFYAWKAGLTAKQTTDFFCAEVYESLRYFDYWDSSTHALFEEGNRCAMPLDSALKQWRSRGCFMHSPNHPKLYVLADLARWILQLLKIPTLPIDPLEVVWDNLADVAIWPVYPEIGKRLGLEGSYLFKGNNPGLPSKAPIVSYELDEFISRSFESYDRYSQTYEITCSRAYTRRYKELFAGGGFKGHQPEGPVGSVNDRRPTHPYASLPPERFWKSAIRDTPAGEVDPVGSSDFLIDRGSRIATGGSCFAQHISNRLQKRGFNYLVTEPAPIDLSRADAIRNNYGVYSARFGNIYSVRQLLQLFDRAFGEFVPSEQAWKRPDGRLVDPFRPEIAPDGFSDVGSLLQSQASHLEAVRQMFESLDVFIFTLGLTEAWRSKIDGAVFPLAPGVVAGELDSAMHEFVNFNVSEVVADLETFLAKLSRRNASARVMLTVSPVPLAATYEHRHVLVSTSYSKSVLRVAAQEICGRQKNCCYFPSFEIITGNFNRGAYFDPDLRAVNAAGVDHVMRLFFAHHAPSAAEVVIDRELLEEAKNNYRIVCEEERLAEFSL